MNLLAIETCFEGCSVAVANPGVRAFRHRLIGRGHAELLAPMIQATLADSGVAGTDLTAIVVCHGPGSFTGIRIGLATARALALPRKLPVYGVTSLELMAWEARRQHAGVQPLPSWIAVLHDARRKEVYGQVFSSAGAAVAAAVTLSRAQVSTWLPQGRGLLIGTGSAILRDALAQSHPACLWCGGSGRPTAQILAHFVRENMPALFDGADKGQRDQPPPAPLPLYLRPADAKLPRAVSG